MVRAGSTFVLALCVLVFGGCYGSTEPATNIGEDSATLRAQGTANNGPATSYFEYWAAEEPFTDALGPRTPARSLPAGASGPFAERVTDLLVASEYSFRLCGFDQNSSSPTPVCAQTRTFTTPTPAGDYVKGTFFVAPAFVVRFNARSGPRGENATGTVKFRSATQTDTETVECLAVNGRRAIVGTLGGRSGPALYEVLDDPGGTDVYRPQGDPGGPDCSTPAPFGLGNEGTTVVVHDAP